MTNHRQIDVIRENALTGLPAAPVAFAADHPEAVTVQDVLRIFWRRLWIIALILIAALATAAVISKKTPKAWDATAQLLLVQPVTVAGPSTQASVVGPTAESVATQITLLQSYEIAQRTVQKLQQDAAAQGLSPDSVGIDAQGLQKATTVTNDTDTDVIDVQVEAPSREQAATWANALCQTFVAYKKEVAQQNSEDLLANLDLRANRAQAQMTQAEQAETAFEQQHHMADMSAQASAILDSYQKQAASATELQTNIHSESTLAASLASQLHTMNHAIATGTAVRDDSLAISMQSQLNALEIQRDEAAQKYTAKYPGILPQLDAQIADLKRRLATAVRGTVNNTQPSLQAQGALTQQLQQVQDQLAAERAQLASVTGQRDHLKRQVQALPSLTMQDARFALNVQVARDLYSQLQSALNAAELDKDQAASDVQMVQPEAFVPEQPTRPNHKRDLAVGGGIGLLLALGAVLLLEQGDRRVRNLANVRRLADGPVIGALPQMTRPQLESLRQGETPLPLVEAFNVVRANLSLAFRSATGTDLWQHNVILVTSAIPGEGKSLAAAELARATARAGKRVILVDADLRRPALDALFPGVTGPGLAEVLDGQATLLEAVQPTGIDHLSILRSGTTRRNPNDLMARPILGETLRLLREQADAVILDTPAASAVADALLLAPQADCILYVIGGGMVDEQTVRDTAASLATAQPRSMAYLLNRAPRAAARPYALPYDNAARAGGTAASAQALMPLLRGAPASSGTTAPAMPMSAGDENRTHSAAELLLLLKGLRVAEPSPTDDPAGPVPLVPGLPGTRLTTLEGPGIGQSLLLPADQPLTVGMANDNDLILTDDPSVSRHHARVVMENGRHILYDNGSANGSYVNGNRVSGWMLKAGDAVQFGGSLFRYE